MKKTAPDAGTMDAHMKYMEMTIVASARVSYAIEGYVYSKEDWDRMDKSSRLIDKPSPFMSKYSGLLAAI